MEAESYDFDALVFPLWDEALPFGGDLYPQMPLRVAQNVFVQIRDLLVARTGAPGSDLMWAGLVDPDSWPPPLGLVAMAGFYQDQTAYIDGDLFTRYLAPALTGGLGKLEPGHQRWTWELKAASALMVIAHEVGHSLLPLSPDMRLMKESDPTNPETVAGPRF